ncbi:acyl carrier protein [Acidocella sp.]|uniref:acyl carrier protein n=1 Tax=Acidocella sp. TaxID=50710 RepID=UPI0026116FE0|nr:phosphopantetheine-binding protein [Acidocella sp.]
MSDNDAELKTVIFETLRAALTKPAELSEATHIVDDLGLDSVAVMDFVMEIEDRLDLSVPLDKIAEIQTLGDLLTVLRGLKAGA